MKRVATARLTPADRTSRTILTFFWLGALLLTTGQAHAELLEGGVSEVEILSNYEQDAPRIELQQSWPDTSGNGSSSTMVDRESAATDSPTAEIPRAPAWITGQVYTTPNMTAEYFANFLFFRGKFVMERRRQNVRLHGNVMNNWHGYKPSNCVITCDPYGPPGNFRFYHSQPNGPRGYLQYIGRGERGFAIYRYWYDSN
jgi:hypothetical protein